MKDKATMTKVIGGILLLIGIVWAIIDAIKMGG